MDDTYVRFLLHLVSMPPGGAEDKRQEAGATWRQDISTTR